MPRRLTTWWSRLTPAERQRAVAVALVCLVYVGHYLVYCWVQPFYIEDAGISYAYAIHLVHGDGLVPYVGG